MSEVISDEMIHTVCKEAFRVCQKSNPKNRSCAGYIARELLVEKRFRRDDAKDAGGRIDRILDKWFTERAADIKFAPPEYEVIETGKTDQESIDTGNTDSELPILHG